MLFNTIKNIFLFLIVVTVFMATNGFTVYQHHCSCSDLAETSVLIKNFDCEHDDEQDDHCCAVKGEKDDCCHQAELPCKEKESHDNEGCCTTTENFFRISIDLKFDQFKPGIQLFSTLAAATGIFKLNQAEESANEFDTPDPPPLLTGRRLLTSLHQLKLDGPHMG
jgi:hypothetical protein